MDVRQLRYFTEVALAHNFREAATRLNISPSSLSRRVADLERDLNIRLFERHPRGVSLTRSGQILLARAENLLRDIESTRAELKGEAQPIGGVVIVGTSTPLSRVLLPPLTARFTGASQSIGLRFVEGAQYVLFEGLDSGRIDLALMTTPEAIPGCKLEILRHEPLYLISKGGRRRKPPAMSFAELDRIPLVVFPRPSGHRNYLERTAAKLGLRLDIRYEVADTRAQLEFVRLGLASCILPISALSHPVDRAHLCATPIRNLTLNRTLVWRGDRHQTAAVSRVADAIRDIIIGSSKGRRDTK